MGRRTSRRKQTFGTGSGKKSNFLHFKPKNLKLATTLQQEFKLSNGSCEIPSKKLEVPRPAAFDPPLPSPSVLPLVFGGDGLFAEVSSEVFVVVGLGGGALAADVAREGLLARVRAQVLGQVVRAVERLVADLARVLLVLLVLAEVAHAVRLAQELHSAHVARVRLQFKMQGTQ